MSNQNITLPAPALKRGDMRLIAQSPHRRKVYRPQSSATSLKSLHEDLMNLLDELESTLQENEK
ncbi:MAG: hypothetical protein ACFHVJ_09825 [Aestuariibacter sp.]